MSVKTPKDGRLPKQNFSPAERTSSQGSGLHFLMKFFRMRVLNWYLFKTVFMAFIMALVIVTFLMLMGSLVQIVELIFKNFSVFTIVKFLAICIPSVLCYALPFSMAGASLLVYSRLSADGEITAMKATGISVFRLSTPPIVLSILIALLSAYTYNNILPKASTTRKEIIAGYEIEDPSALIETGTWINYDNYRLFIEDRDGNFLRNIQLVEDDDGKIRRIDARSGKIRYLALENKLHFEMNGVVSEEHTNDTNSYSYLRMQSNRVDLYIDMKDKKRRTKEEIMKKRSIDEYTTKELYGKLEKNHFELVRKACRKLPEFKALPQSNRTAFVENLSENKKQELVASMFVQLKQAHKKWSDLQKQKTWKAMLKKMDEKSGDAWVDIVNKQTNEYVQTLIALEGHNGPVMAQFEEWQEIWPQGFHNALDQRSRCKTTINYRLSYAFASIAFVIIGVPLGIRAQRSEKTIGFLICLMLIAVHYTLVIVVTQFKEYYGLHPEILIWMPDLLFVLTGFYLMWRNHNNS